MAKIPTGNFGNEIATWAPRATVPVEAFSQGEGLKKLGDVGMNIAGQMIDEQQKLDEKVATLKAHGEIQAGLADAKDGVIRGIADGTVPKESAVMSFETASKKFIDSKLTTIPEHLKPVLGAEAINLSGEFGRSVRDAALFRGQQDSKAGLLDFGEQMQRFAVTDPEHATSQALRAFDDIGPKAGMNPVELQKTKQTWLESVAFTAGTKLITDSQNSLEAMDQAQKDLSGPRFANLDPQKREVLSSSLMAHRLRLEAKFQHTVDRMDAKGEQTINAVDRQIASGVPATPEMWNNWASTVRGTSSEGEFQSRIKDEAKVQEVLRLPIEQQSAFVQKKTTELLPAVEHCATKPTLTA